MSCKGCISNLKSKSHNCTTHSACYKDKLWSPSNCLQCSELFEKADKNDDSSIDKLKSLYKKFADRSSNRGFGKTIFASEYEYHSFFRTFLTVHSRKEDKENVQPNLNAPSSSKSILDLPIPRVTSIEEVVSSVDFNRESPISEIPCSLDPENLILNQNQLSGILSDSASFPLAELVVVPNSSVPEISSRNVLTQECVGTQLSSNPGRVSYTPPGNPFLISSVGSRQPQINFGTASVSSSLFGSNTQAFVPQPLFSGFIPTSLNSFGSIRSQPSTMRSSFGNGMHPPANSLRPNFPPQTNWSNPQTVNPNPVLYQQPNLGSRNSVSCPQSLVPSPRPNMQALNSEHDGQLWEEEEVPQQIVNPVFTHWPSMEALTSLDDSMLTFLNQTKPPILFVLPSSSPTLMITEQGLVFLGSYLSSQDVFVGLLDNKWCLAIKHPSTETAQLTLNLERYEKEDVSVGDIDPNKLGALISSYCEHAHDEFGPCEYKLEDGNLEIIFNSLNLENLKSSKVNLLAKFKKFSSVDKNDDNILSCLQEPALGKDSHLIPDAIQEVTSPLSKEDKDKDFSKRKAALKAVIAYASCKETFKAISHFYDNANSQTKKDENFVMFTGLKGFNQLSLKFLEASCLKALDEVKDFRKELRSKSTLKVNESVIRNKLINTDLWSVSLFSKSANTLISHAVESQAPRNISLKKVSSEGNAKNPPSKGNRRQSDTMALKSLWQKSKFNRGKNHTYGAPRFLNHSYRNFGPNFSRSPGVQNHFRFPNPHNFRPRQNFDNQLSFGSFDNSHSNPRFSSPMNQNQALSFPMNQIQANPTGTLAIVGSETFSSGFIRPSRGQSRGRGTSRILRGSQTFRGGRGGKF